MTAQVLQFDTPETRAALVRAHLAKTDPLVQLNTLQDAVKLLDRWIAHARRLEVMLGLATAQRDASDLLLSIAEDTIMELKGLK